MRWRNVKGRPWNKIKKGLTIEEVKQWKTFAHIYENAKAYWLSEITDKRNIADWIKPNSPLSAYRIERELWHYKNKLNRMSANKEVAKEREKAKKNVFDDMQKNSENILDKTFDMNEGGMEMKDSERARLALDFKKSTDRQYNPVQAVDISIWELNFEDLDELKEQLSEELNLLSKEKETNE